MIFPESHLETGSFCMANAVGYSNYMKCESNDWLNELLKDIQQDSQNRTCSL
jgi:hypothetical protein